MEQNKFRCFELVAGDRLLIMEVIEYYNSNYQKDFELVKFDNRDGVLFATVKYLKASTDDVFQLGCFFGMSIQLKRDKKEIDW